MKEKELIKGTIEMVVLGIVKRERETYAYKVFQELRGDALSVEEASVYGIFRRLKAKGWLSSRHVPSEQGPPRLVYKLTKSGQEALTEQRDRWRDMARAVDRLVPAMGMERV